MLPALIVGIKADAVAQRTSQARNLAQSQMERLRNLPFHVAYDVGSEYVDLLDRYYEDLDAPATSVACGSSGDWTLPDDRLDRLRHRRHRPLRLGAGDRALLPPGAGRHRRGHRLRHRHHHPAALRRLPAAGGHPAVSDWDSQRSGTDSPPASQVGVTVTVFSSLAGDREPVSTSSQLTRQSLTTPRVEASVQVSALQLGTNVMVTDPTLVDPVAVPLTLSAGLVDLAGSVTATSTTDAVLGSTLTGIGTGEQARGASASAAAPADSSVLATSSAAGALDAAGCDLACWGGTRTTAFPVRASNGLPVVGDPADPATATVTDLASGGVSLAAGPDADYRERLSLAGPLVRLADDSSQVKAGISSSCAVAETGESVRVVAGGWLRTVDRAPTSASLQVDACGAARASTLSVLPTSFAPKGVLQVRLVRASARCTVSGAAHAPSADVDYQAVVRRWTGSDSDPYTTVATIVPGTGTDPLAGLDLSSIALPGHGVLGDYIASWSSVTQDQVVRTETAGSATVDLPALVSVVTQPVRSGTEPLATSTITPTPSPTPARRRRRHRRRRRRRRPRPERGGERRDHGRAHRHPTVSPTASPTATPTVTPTRPPPRPPGRTWSTRVLGLGIGRRGVLLGAGRPMRHAPGPAVPDEEPLPRDAGMTMAEVLVSMMLFAVLGSVLLSFALATAQVTDRVQASGDLTGESRLAFQRFSRELRQASDIRAVQFSTGTGTTTAITFWTDFDGDGVVDLDASDPEVLTYRWDPDTQRLTLTANDASGTAVTRPVLAGRVTDFELQLRSSLWQHDALRRRRTDDVAGARRLPGRQRQRRARRPRAGARRPDRRRAERHRRRRRAHLLHPDRPAQPRPELRTAPCPVPRPPRRGQRPDHHRDGDGAGGRARHHRARRDCQQPGRHPPRHGRHAGPRRRRRRAEPGRGLPALQRHPGLDDCSPSCGPANAWGDEDAR